ncbi:MAG: flagellar assembly protein FliW [bacterium]
MIIDTFRFGPLEIPEDKIISMERPILGFEQLRRFCLIERDELAPFLWLQALDDSAVAFLVVNPAVFYPDYRIEVNPREIAELHVKRLEDVETYVVVTAPEDPAAISVNLQGPIIINTAGRRAKQLVLVNSSYQVTHRLMDVLDSYADDEVEQVQLAQV